MSIRARRITHVLVVIAMAVLTSTAAFSVTAQPVRGGDAIDPVPVPVRVMLAGDSITQEYAGDNTWRWRLWNEFHRQQVPVDFVGPVSGNYGTITLPLHPWDDDQHDARVGMRLLEAQQTIEDQVETYRPDVVLLLLGFNDLNHGATVDETVARMESYLAQVWAADPAVHVVVSPLLASVYYPSGEPRTLPLTTTSAAYATLVDRLAAEGRPISSASAEAPWTARVDTCDGVHPNPTGETVIAQRFAASLHELGVLPEAPNVAVAYEPWIADPHAHVSQLANRVMHFTWTYYMVRLTMHRGQVRIDGRRLAHPLVVRTGEMVAYRNIRLPRGSYTVRLAPIRHWLLGRYGPPVPFSVR